MPFSEMVAFLIKAEIDIAHTCSKFWYEEAFSQSNSSRNFVAFQLLLTDEEPSLYSFSV